MADRHDSLAQNGEVGKEALNNTGNSKMLLIIFTSEGLPVKQVSYIPS